MRRRAEKDRVGSDRRIDVFRVEILAVGEVGQEQAVGEGRIGCLDREIDDDLLAARVRRVVVRAEREAEAWDREIERDAASGKLDKLFEKSIADHRAGKSREI